MTGFARNSVTTGALSVTAECRSVNNRYLDLQFRMPDALRELEGDLRALVAERVTRGKLDILIRVTDAEADQSLALNPDRVHALRTALLEMGAAFPESAPPDLLSLLLTPGMTKEHNTDTETLKGAVISTLAGCIDQLVEQRRAEGAQLAQFVRQRCEQMALLLGNLRDMLPAIQKAHRQKLLSRLDALDLSAEPSRLEEEIVYVLQRADVEEEMDRLQAHLDAIGKSLASSGPCGRRLDFLMQELNREANTLSSKALALDTTNTAVEFKVLIEQMREQIQNIE